MEKQNKLIENFYREILPTIPNRIPPMFFAEYFEAFLKKKHGVDEPIYTSLNSPWFYDVNIVEKMGWQENVVYSGRLSELSNDLIGTVVQFNDGEKDDHLILSYQMLNLDNADMEVENLLGGKEEEKILIAAKWGLTTNNPERIKFFLDETKSLVKNLKTREKNMNFFGQQ